MIDVPGKGWYAACFGMSILLVAGCGPADDCQHERFGASAREFPNRNVAAVEWDTLLVLGTPDVQDTTFLMPTRVAVWPGGDLLVVDIPSLRVQRFTATGELLWTFAARYGRGPSELQTIGGFAFSPEGNLWLSDNRNAKILEIDGEGLPVREIGLQHLPFLAVNLQVLGDRVFYLRDVPHWGIVELDPETFEVLSERQVPWLEPVGDDYIRRLASAGSPDETWVLAMTFGPGFVVFQGDSARAYRYIDEIPYALRISPARREAGADSARYGTRAMQLVEDEIFMLFGGRPNRMRQDPEPTRLIDVYGVDGEYRRSYVFPHHIVQMATQDGELFYFMIRVDDLYPTVLAVRPVPTACD